MFSSIAIQRVARLDRRIVLDVEHQEFRQKKAVTTKRHHFVLLSLQRKGKKRLARLRRGFVFFQAGRSKACVS